MQRTSFAYRSWWLTPGLLALAGMLLALAACAPGGVSASPGQSQVTNPSSQSTAPATPTQAAGSGNADQGTLNGTVVAGPSCPIETSDYPCPPKPVPNRQVMIETPDGKIAATPTTDSDGRFSVNLAPGTYVVNTPALKRGACGRTPPQLCVSRKTRSFGFAVRHIGGI